MQPQRSISVRLGTLSLAALLLAPVIALSLHPACNFIFECGCEPVWAGGVEHCNIYVPEAPDCPWCTGGLARTLWVGAIVLGAPLLLAARSAMRGRRLWRVLLAGLLGYAAGALLAGLLAALVTGYPRWMGQILSL